MWVLLGCSVIGAAIILERSLVYLGYGLRPDPWLERVLAELRRGGIGTAESMAGTGKHPVARVVETCLEYRERSAKSRSEAVRRTGSIVLESVEARLRVLAAIAHLAPLIGLLGTVIGMVVAFAQIQALEGTVKPADLAGGIWEALLTTVFGLVVAIPCMAAFHAFESHADKIARRMQLAVPAVEDALGLDEPTSVPASEVVDEDNWSTVS